MVKRLCAILFIFACTSVGWMILGATIWNRTNSAGDRTRGSVQSIWGTAQTQIAPRAEYTVAVPYRETIKEKGVQRIVEKTRDAVYSLRPTSSEVAAGVNLAHRKKGLLWYSTYQVAFRGDYEFTNPDDVQRELTVTLPFPASKAMYDDLQFLVNDQPHSVETGKTGASVDTAVGAHQTVKVHVAYKSQGLDSWRYGFGPDVTQVANFHLRLITDFKDIDFPENSLAPSEKRESANGWILDWNYKNLLSGYQIALIMPDKLQPGPLAADISFFAPVSLFFFFFMLFLITTLRSLDLHPMNYFFLAGAFFAFHLLLAYLVDHIDIRAAFAIASAVSVFLDHFLR
ncbi:MAG TPA: inner membrane CreD family protein [Bryobacteraceae bacterium]|nr:inner membrane CreD family protein [Candidatus Sulfotelmatobacter sp.]HXP86889.1 inner membrane CreD family protein [Bryobacteraceae bacterium]